MASGVVAALLDLPDRRGLAVELGELCLTGDYSHEADADELTLVLDVRKDRPDWDRLRSALLLTLERLGPDGLPGLQRILKSQDAADHRGAAASLRTVGKPALDTLLKNLGDPDFEVKKSVIAALRAIGPETVGQLRAILADSHADMRAREAAVDVLSGFGLSATPAVKELSEVLTSTTGEKERSLRLAAIRALAKLGPAAKPAIDALRAALNDPDLKHAILCGGRPENDRSSRRCRAPLRVAREKPSSAKPSCE
jgi:HEAT repeat protein